MSRIQHRSRRRLTIVVGVVALLAIAAACTPVAQKPPPQQQQPSKQASSGGGSSAGASACTNSTSLPTTQATAESPPAEPATSAPTSTAPAAPTEPVPTEPVPTGPVPTEQAPIEYVAVVDDPGASAPDVVTFTVSSEAERDAEVAVLEQDGPVVALEPNATVEAATTPQPNDDPGYPEQWGLPKAGFPGSWATGLDGTGQIVAILDTGVQADQPDLVGQVLSGQDFVDDNTTSDFGRKDLFNGTHGTAVAGIVAEIDNVLDGIGGAPAAKILPVRVLNNDGAGKFSDVAQGITWAADHGATVINMSFAAAAGECSSSIQKQIDYARSKKIVVVAAAGNSNTDQLGAPGGSEGVITVGATKKNENKKADYSNYGQFVDIGAPGDDIYSTKKTGAFGASSGTSLSSPFVAAAAALLKQKCPSFSPDQVLNDLKKAATVNVSGLGAKLLDVDAATASC